MNHDDEDVDPDIPSVTVGELIRTLDLLFDELKDVQADLGTWGAEFAQRGNLFRAATFWYVAREISDLLSGSHALLAALHLSGCGAHEAQIHALLPDLDSLISEMKTSAKALDA